MLSSSFIRSCCPHFIVILVVFAVVACRCLFCALVGKVEADIAPFRALLLGMFFMTVGFEIDLVLCFNNLPLVASLVSAGYVMRLASSTFVVGDVVVVVGVIHSGRRCRRGRRCYRYCRRDCSCRRCCRRQYRPCFHLISGVNHNKRCHRCRRRCCCVIIVVVIAVVVITVVVVSMMSRAKRNKSQIAPSLSHTHDTPDREKGKNRRGVFEILTTGNMNDTAVCFRTRPTVGEKKKAQLIVIGMRFRPQWHTTSCCPPPPHPPTRSAYLCTCHEETNVNEP